MTQLAMDLATDALEQTNAEGLAVLHDVANAIDNSTATIVAALNEVAAAIREIKR
jgi:hypothetical protein